MHLHDANSKMFSPDQFAATAATIQTLVNSAVCTSLPSREQWLLAYNNDVELCAVQDLVLNLSMIDNKALAEVNHNYRGPLSQSLIFVENEMLIMKEPIAGTLSYTRFGTLKDGYVRRVSLPRVSSQTQSSPTSDL